MDEAKPFCVSKWEVLEAYKQVKANKGAAGVDGLEISAFDDDWQDNLYKLWNRMSSGSYFPQPVRRVEIPKPDGRKRPLGIPTVADRIAQTVVKNHLEPELDPIFHQDSYGFRPGRSAIDAVGVARQRCWRNGWVVDLDIKAFFDNIDHGLLMRAVRKHTDCRWVLLYIERWLKAPVQLPDGTLESRDKGTPQGGVISPLLANLYLHYAFDNWMERNYPTIPFERYADDVICHCKSEAQASWMREEIGKRMAECGLELHPEKTKIVYCKEGSRKGNYPNEKFDFLGFTFRPRVAKDRYGRFFVGFLPAASDKALKAMRQTMRGWWLHRKTTNTLEDLARIYNPIVRGWINYYGSFYRSALVPTFLHLDWRLAKWANRKYKRLKRRQKKARRWLRKIRSRQPNLFAHWELLFKGWTIRAV